MPEVIKRKIVVEVGYHDFVFPDLNAANAFAYVAKSHLKEDDKGRHVGIIVNYYFEEQEEEEQEEEEQDDQTTD